MESTQCLECRHYQGLHRYHAFPDGIPEAIFTTSRPSQAIPW